MGQTIEYIKSLEKTKATLEKRKQEQALARQAVSSSSAAPPQAAQGMAAKLSTNAVPDGCHGVPPLAAAAAAATAAATCCRHDHSFGHPAATAAAAPAATCCRGASATAAPHGGGRGASRI